MFNLNLFSYSNFILEISENFDFIFSILINFIYYSPIMLILLVLLSQHTSTILVQRVRTFIFWNMMGLFLILLIYLILSMQFDFDLLTHKYSVMNVLLLTEVCHNLFALNLFMTYKSFWFFITLALTFMFCLHFFLYYMESDPEFKKFLMYYLSFYVSMLGVVSSENFFSFFMNWELMGLFSFMLITFWNNSLFAIQSGKQALFINKMGDMCLLFGLIYFYYLFKTSDFDDMGTVVIEVAEFINLNKMLTLLLLFLIASFTKSAQWGFHQWLPAAMEGPTPVSALLHAATLVTAGVILWMKLSDFFLMSNEWIGLLYKSHMSWFNILLIMQGLITCFGASFFAAIQLDIKKTIAFSTTSHLGLMFMAMGLKLFNLALLHLIIHAIFKSLMFMMSGSLLHFNYGEQDLSSIKFTRLLHSNLLGLSGLVAGGLSFTSGFFSKELILENSLYSGWNWNIVLYSYILFSLIYCFKLSTFQFQTSYKLFFNSFLVNQYKYTMKTINQASLMFYIFMCGFAWLSMFLMSILYQNLDLLSNNKMLELYNHDVFDVFFFNESFNSIQANQYLMKLTNLITVEHNINFFFVVIVMLPMMNYLLSTSNMSIYKSMMNLFRMNSWIMQLFMVISNFYLSKMFMLYTLLLSSQFYLKKLHQTLVQQDLMMKVSQIFMWDFFSTFNLKSLTSIGFSRLYISMILILVCGLTVMYM